MVAPCVRCCPSCWPGGSAGETVGVGTVVATFQSRPASARRLDAGRPRRRRGRLGLRRLRRGRGLRAAQEVVAVGAPVLQRYGVSDDDAFAVGLTCGGILDVFVEKVDRETFPELGEIAADIEAGRPVAVATVIDHPDPAGSAAGWSCARTMPASRDGTLGLAARSTTRCTTTRWGCSRPGTARR